MALKKFTTTALSYGITSNIVFNPVNNYFYVANYDGVSRPLWKISPSGVPTVLANNTYNQSLAINPSTGVVYVGRDLGNIYQVTTGDVVSSFSGDGSNGSASILFNTVTGLVFRTAYWSDWIYKYNSSGSVTNTFYHSRPSKLINDSLGNVFSCSSTGNVYKIDTSNNMSTYSTVSGVLRDMVMDKAGNLFVVDESSGKVKKINTSGTASDFWTATGSPNLQRIAIDSADNLYVSDYANGKIFKITPAGVSTELVTGATNVLHLTWVDGKIYYNCSVSNDLYYEDASVYKPSLFPFFNNYI